MKIFLFFSLLKIQLDKQTKILCQRNLKFRELMAELFTSKSFYKDIFSPISVSLPVKNYSLRLIS